jgi:hypothetical protein
MMMFEKLLVPLPDVEGCVHGIVSLDPPKVQCDGCGLVATGVSLAVTVLTCGIVFDLRESDDVRLCADCRGAE